ncbi:MAG TPA: hypothetical protein VGZ93_10225 [Candidatus Methylacidiphilales bacterium]|jgi:hypothetical protein|nr:hypothetical protein [Candidatus Methylacidiphilales bacterium]
MDAQGNLLRFIHNRATHPTTEDVIWSWRRLCFVSGMNVRRHTCGRGERLDAAILGVTRAGFVFVEGRLFAVPAAHSRKTESICASPTRY